MNYVNYNDDLFLLNFQVLFRNFILIISKIYLAKRPNRSVSPKIFQFLPLFKLLVPFLFMFSLFGSIHFIELSER